MINILQNCKFPQLENKFDIALREAISFILENYTVRGIIVSGTIIRGNPDKSSDLDIYVINKENFRQRVQMYFNSIPAEIFINPIKKIENYLIEEQVDRRPSTAHMISTGFVIYETDSAIAELKTKAKETLESPLPAPTDLTMDKYMIACLYEDAVDVKDKDPLTCLMYLNRTINELANFYFIKEGMYIPRGKDILNMISDLEYTIGTLFKEFYSAELLKIKLKKAQQLMQILIKEEGFFEWKTEPERLS